jgi:hypothetical protein
MRTAVLCFALTAGTVAFAQSSPAKPAEPFKLELTPPSVNQSRPDLQGFRADLHPSSKQLWKTFTISGPRQLQRKDSAQIDPGMIVRPSQSSIGAQPPGTPIAQNLYPGLRLLPIEETQAKLETLPTEWPNLELQNIPIKWPKFAIQLVNGGSAKPAE